ncbi:MAG: hypothetical protein JWS10_1057 [Cypionkella sp.]|uniref:hypothetical protein n=1 Tax=Cypionkella sp. TaxID=2811411 RepID=UPI0026294DD2|nr:hypothetical protein [Cypionkella sp.]MDB5658442.1 hypothetical protein [Cypionkella sp.]
MNIEEIQAIIPVGFYSGPAGRSEADELYVHDGMSLLSRALAEVAGAGIAKAVIAITDVALPPRWISAAVQASLRDLETLGLPALQTEVMYLGRCATIDDAIACAMSCVTTPWAAVICPLLKVGRPGGLSQVLNAAQTADSAVIGIARTDWETAIQLCSLTLWEISQLRLKNIARKMTSRWFMPGAQFFLWHRRRWMVFRPTPLTRTKL